MNNITKISEIKKVINEWKRAGYSIGLVPTMGYLHNGHISLIEKARQENDKVVVSIFVNPIQFGPNEDFEKYPRNLQRDLKMCEQAGADIVFSPSEYEIYPSKKLAFVDVAELGDTLCGAARPGHFGGVCTIVAKLFNIIIPNRAYFGEKDAQQLAIIKKMAEDLSYDIEIIPCPIVREPDGLAMSSRNSYLSVEERKASAIISKSLALAKKKLYEGERKTENISQLIFDIISSEPLAKINYVEIVDTETLKAVSNITSPILIAVAVSFGKTRLIDNFFFKEV